MEFTLLEIFENCYCWKIIFLDGYIVGTQFQPRLVEWPSEKRIQTRYLTQLICCWMNLKYIPTQCLETRSRLFIKSTASMEQGLSMWLGSLVYYLTGIERLSGKPFSKFVGENGCNTTILDPQQPPTVENC